MSYASFAEIPDESHWDWHSFTEELRNEVRRTPEYKLGWEAYKAFQGNGNSWLGLKMKKPEHYEWALVPRRCLLAAAHSVLGNRIDWWPDDLPPLPPLGIQRSVQLDLFE